MNVEILKMVTVSTTHILPSTSDLLDRMAAEENAASDECSQPDGIAVYPKGDYGWFVYFYEDELLSEVEQSGHSRLPKDLHECIKFAALHGCNILCLDRDGEEFPGFLNDYSENWQCASPDEADSSAKIFLSFEGFNAFCSKHGLSASVHPTTPFRFLAEAKNTDGEWTRWFGYDSSTDTPFVYGNTDQLNIWLCDTRPGISAEEVIQFIEELNLLLRRPDNDRFSVSDLVDPEDWQVIADVPDAFDDERYTK